MSKGLSQIDNAIKFIVIKSRRTNKCQEISLIYILYGKNGMVPCIYRTVTEVLFVVPFCTSHHHHRNHHIRQPQSLTASGDGEAGAVRVG